MFTDILPVSPTYYVPGIVLLARATTVNKTLNTLFSWALRSQKVLLCVKYYLWIVSCAIVQSSINNILSALFLNFIFLFVFIPRYFKVFIFIIYVLSPTTYSISLLLIFRQLILKCIKHFPFFLSLVFSSASLLLPESPQTPITSHTLEAQSRTHVELVPNTLTPTYFCKFQEPLDFCL